MITGNDSTTLLFLFLYFSHIQQFTPDGLDGYPEFSESESRLGFVLSDFFFFWDETEMVLTYIFWDSSSGKLRDLIRSPGWKILTKAEKKLTRRAYQKTGKFHHFTRSMGQPR